MNETSNVQEQFEAALTKLYEAAGADEPNLRTIDGRYVDPLIQSAWWDWQASREALVVELTDRKGESTRGNGFNDALSECRASIEAQGLKVAP